MSEIGLPIATNSGFGYYVYLALSNTLQGQRGHYLLQAIHREATHWTRCLRRGFFSFCFYFKLFPTFEFFFKKLIASKIYRKIKTKKCKF